MVMQVHSACGHSACQTRHLCAKKKGRALSVNKPCWEFLFCWNQVLLGSSLAGHACVRFNICWTIGITKQISHMMQLMLASVLTGEIENGRIQHLLDSFCWI